MIFFLLQNRFYHFGYDKPDNVDEVGQPLPEDEFAENSYMATDEQQQNDADDEACDYGNKTQIMLADRVEVKEANTEIKPDDEGTKATLSKEIFPQINNNSCKDVINEDAMINLKRSDSALNIFDQTTILKLISATNWTETFFNRIFRKKFLVIAPGDETFVEAFKNGFALEQQLKHISQFRTRDSLPLPALVAPERDTKLTHGLFFLSLLSFRMQDVFKYI
jgi:hypothetical protein